MQTDNAAKCAGCLPTARINPSSFCTAITYVCGWPEPYIYRYIQCTYGIFGREIIIHTIIYGATIRFWPTLYVRCIFSIFGRKIIIHSVIYGVYIRFCPNLPVFRTCIFVNCYIFSSHAVALQACCALLTSLPTWCWRALWSACL